VSATASFVETGSCWVCRGTALYPYHEALFDLSPYREQDPELAAYTGCTVRLCRCPSCGFAQPDRIPSLPNFFDRMYDQLWSEDWVASEFDGTYKDVIFRRTLDLLGARVSKGRRLLDVGAHAGRFLHMARQAGWNPEGVEVNTRTASFAASRTGARVHHVSASRLHMLEPGYDALTLIDVLEHIPHPLAVLSSVRAILAPRGWIAVKVPCGPIQRLKEDVRARLSPGYAPRLADNLVHVNHFSPGSLELALAKAGFDAIHIEVGAPECPPASAPANALRLLLYGLGRTLPFGTHTPLALNLQACARKC
jgi:hypothetical protein